MHWQPTDWTQEPKSAILAFLPKQCHRQKSPSQGYAVHSLALARILSAKLYKAAEEQEQQEAEKEHSFTFFPAIWGARANIFLPNNYCMCLTPTSFSDPNPHGLWPLMFLNCSKGRSYSQEYLMFQNYFSLSNLIPPRDTSLSLYKQTSAPC